MKKLLTLSFCLGLLACSQTSDSELVVDLNTNYERSARGFLVLYPLSEMKDSIKNKVIYPDLSEVSDTVYAETYFTGNNHSALEKEVLLLVGNPDSKAPLIFTDYNNNLNFTDDRGPSVFSEENVDISIPDIIRPDIQHTTRFYKASPEQKKEMQKMVESFITKGRPYTDFICINE